MTQNELRRAVESFRAEFPVNRRPGETTSLSPHQFDEWGHRNGFLNAPPADISKQSDAWIAHRERRNLLREKINNLAIKKQEGDAAPLPYTIVAVSPNLYQVLSPAAAIALSDVPHQFGSLVRTKKRQLDVLLASADLHLLSDAEQVYVRTLHRQISNFGEIVSLQASQISQVFADLRGRLRHLVETKELLPQDNGIFGILEASPEDIEEEGDAS